MFNGQGTRNLNQENNNNPLAPVNEQPNRIEQNIENQEQQAAPAAPNDDHWNPMEWDRAAEDLTWDRVIRYFNYALINALINTQGKKEMRNEKRKEKNKIHNLNVK